jgi:hypothetical protein
MELHRGSGVARRELHSLLLNRPFGVTYTRRVRRLGAILTGTALVLANGVIPTLHTHVYTDHDHPEHHHGLAIHEHHQPAPHPDDEGPSLEPCDPSQHAASFVIGGGPGPQVHVNHAECPSRNVYERPGLSRSIRAVTDVRVHGPPLRTQHPSRAPPLTFPA